MSIVHGGPGPRCFGPPLYGALTKGATRANLVLSTRLIKPNLCFDLSHRRSTTVPFETRN